MLHEFSSQEIYRGSRKVEKVENPLGQKDSIHFSGSILGQNCAHLEADFLTRFQKAAHDLYAISRERTAVWLAVSVSSILDDALDRASCYAVK